MGLNEARLLDYCYFTDGTRELPSCKHAAPLSKREEWLWRWFRDMRLPSSTGPDDTGPGHKAASASQRAGPLCSFNMPSCHYPEPWGSWELGTVPVRPEGGTSSQRGGSSVLRPNGICPARSWTNLNPSSLSSSMPLWNGECLSYAHPVTVFWKHILFHRFIAGEMNTPPISPMPI